MEAERLLREARRLAKLRHPGIVAVHDVGTQDGQIFVISEYLAGQDLAHWLRRTTPSWQQAVKLVIAVADALAYAHSQLMVHRDVKPANIILTSAGDPVLVDFGLRWMTRRPVVENWESSPARRRTWPPSRSPGSHTGSTAARTSTVWAWCCTRCCAAAFRSGRSNIRSSCGRSATMSHNLAADCSRDSPELERICLKALAKKAQDRYTTAVDFAEDLRRVVQAIPESGPALSFRQSEAGTAGPSQQSFSQRDVSQREGAWRIDAVLVAATRP